MSAAGQAIQTVYRGARFRSRLEARWAAFFDLLGWRWEYEPVDLDGYIPDFMLLLRQPVLVEVKPAWTCEQLEQLAAAKIERSGWDGEALIVGLSWATTDAEGWLDSAVLGANSEAAGDRSWAHAVWFACRGCGSSRSFLSFEGSYACRLHGCYDGDHHINHRATDLGGLAELWNMAGSAVRWTK